MKQIGVIPQNQIISIRKLLNKKNLTLKYNDNGEKTFNHRFLSKMKKNKKL